MTDTTAARRALLALLLDRVERGALLPAEAPLIRPLVDAQQTDTTRAEQAEDLLRIAHETSNRSEAERDRAARRADRLETAARAVLDICGDQGSDVQDILRAALDAPSDGGPTPAQTYYRGNDGAEMHAEYMRLLTAVARVRELGSRMRAPSMGPVAHSWADEVDAILDGPSPTPDDEQATAYCRVMETRTCPPAGPCGGPCARFESDDPTPWLPDGTPTPVIDALRAGQPVTVARCSPLVNLACPGHTDGTTCDRAASIVTAAPDWSRLAEQPPVVLAQDEPADAPSEQQP